MLLLLNFLYLHFHFLHFPGLLCLFSASTTDHNGQLPTFLSHAIMDKTSVDLCCDMFAILEVDCSNSTIKIVRKMRLFTLLVPTMQWGLWGVLLSWSPVFCANQLLQTASSGLLLLLYLQEGGCQTNVANSLLYVPVVLMERNYDGFQLLLAFATLKAFKDPLYLLLMSVLPVIF
jgi:hypothetical protein